MADESNVSDALPKVEISTATDSTVDDGQHERDKLIDIQAGSCGIRELIGGKTVVYEGNKRNWRALLQNFCTIPMSGEAIEYYLNSVKEAREQFDPESLSLHRIAIENGNISALRALLKFHTSLVDSGTRSATDWNRDIRKLMEIAAESNKLEIMKHLFDSYQSLLVDVPKHEWGDRLLAKAVAHRESLQFLLQHYTPYQFDPLTGTVGLEAVSAAISQRVSWENFKVLLDHVASATFAVDLFNGASETRPFANPVRTAINAGCERHLEALLLWGFRPDAAKVRLKRIRGQRNTFFDGERTYDLRDHALSLVGFNFPPFAYGADLGSVALAIFQGNFNMVELLLQHGARVNNGGHKRELAPMDSLIWTQQPHDDCDDEYTRLFYRLVEAEADLERRWDLFSCSDVAIAAACTNNRVALRHLITAQDLSPVNLLWDMVRNFAFLGRQGTINAVRVSVCRSVRSMLVLAKDDRQFVNLCQAIASAAERFPSLGEVRSSMREIGEDTLLSAERRGDTLQEMCRMAILRRIIDVVKVKSAATSSCSGATANSATGSDIKSIEAENSDEQPEDSLICDAVAGVGSLEGEKKLLVLSRQRTVNDALSSLKEDHDKCAVLADNPLSSVTDELSLPCNVLVGVRSAGGGNEQVALLKESLTENDGPSDSKQEEEELASDNSNLEQDEEELGSDDPLSNIIDKLPVPGVLRQYLKFEREIAAMDLLPDDEEYASSSACSSASNSPPMSPLLSAASSDDDSSDSSEDSSDSSEDSSDSSEDSERERVRHQRQTAETTWNESYPLIPHPAVTESISSNSKPFARSYAQFDSSDMHRMRNRYVEPTGNRRHEMHRV